MADMPVHLLFQLGMGAPNILPCIHWQQPFHLLIVKVNYSCQLLFSVDLLAKGNWKDQMSAMASSSWYFYCALLEKFSLWELGPLDPQGLEIAGYILEDGAPTSENIFSRGAPHLGI